MKTRRVIDVDSCSATGTAELDLWYFKDRYNERRARFVSFGRAVIDATLNLTGEKYSLSLGCGITRGTTRAELVRYKDAVPSEWVSDGSSATTRPSDAGPRMTIPYPNLLACFSYDKRVTDPYGHNGDDFAVVRIMGDGLNLVSSDWDAPGVPVKQKRDRGALVNHIEVEPFELELPSNPGGGTFMLWYQYIDGGGGVLGAFQVKWDWDPQALKAKLDIQSVRDPKDPRYEPPWEKTLRYGGVKDASGVESEGKLFEDKTRASLSPRRTATPTTLPTARPPGR
jgi:hypothetical protein